MKRYLAHKFDLLKKFSLGEEATTPKWAMPKNNVDLLQYKQIIPTHIPWAGCDR